MKDHTLEWSHTSVKRVTGVLLETEIFKSMKELTLERSHTSAKLVTSGLLKRETYRCMKDPTRERSHTNAKRVRGVLLEREVYENMKDCTLNSNHILLISMKHSLAGFSRRNLTVLSSSLATIITMINTWSRTVYRVIRKLPQICLPSRFAFGWFSHSRRYAFTQH